MFGWRRILIVFALLFCFVAISSARPSRPAPMQFGTPNDNYPTFNPSDKSAAFPGAVTMGRSSVAIPATGVLTEIMHKGQVLKDSSLSAATDVQLLDLEYATKFYILVTTGTYGISLVPPSGEPLIRIKTAQTADYEMDLSHTQYDEFVVERFQVGANWRYRVTPIIGSVVDGGAAD